ncbi:uncharacterized protein LOC135370159 [Ornithodoros turicata]|uniref:uncharacterized protein LOC135370159 n=1 Tax=Ornithodoros turicata TaxID=34597 RepID=UPI0031395870
MYSLKTRDEELCSAAEPVGRSFFVRYLGCNRFQSRAKQRGVKALQRPLLDLYSTARRKGEDRRSVHPLALTQRLDVSHYGLVVAEPVDDPETRKTVTAVTRVITPASNVVLWAALRFSARLAKRRSIGAAFVPLACSEDVVDRSWYVGLPTKRRFLVGLAHPPLFACLFRQVAAPKTWECHAFLCASAEDALLICSSLAEARNSVVVLDRPPRLIKPEYSDFSDAFTSCASSYSPRHFGHYRKHASSIDEPQSSVTASASGYYQVIDRRTKVSKRPSKRFPPRTDTESKSSISEDRKRRVRRKSNAHKYRDASNTTKVTSASLINTFPDSSAGNEPTAHAETNSSIVASHRSSRGTYCNGGFQSDLRLAKVSDDSSSGQTPTNDTGYFSSKSKSGNASKETDQEETFAVNVATTPKSLPKATYYFGQHTSHTEHDKSKPSVTSYTYFLNDTSRRSRDTTAIWKREESKTKVERSTTESPRVVVTDTVRKTKAPETISDSSLSGYHSDSCCQTKDAGTMTKDSCCYSDCSCSCDLSSVCSDCSLERCGCRKAGAEMTMSETMNLSSEYSEPETIWGHKASETGGTYTYTLPQSSDFRVRGRSEGASMQRPFTTQAQVHHLAGREVEYQRATKESTTKEASTSTTSTIRGNGTSKVVIDVQYDSPKPSSISPGVISFNKHGHVRDWASLSRCSDSSHVTTITTLPLQKTQQRPTKALRWSNTSERRHSGLLYSLKKLSIASFTKAKRRTGKIFSSVRTKMKKQDKPEEEEDHNSVNTSEVCLSPDGNRIPKRKRRRLSWSFHDLRSALGNNSSKGVVVVHRPRRKKKCESQDKVSSETSDSGMDDYKSYARYDQRRKSDSELKHFANEVTHIQVHHGVEKDNFRRWSNTNLHSELGYMP